MGKRTLTGAVILLVVAGFIALVPISPYFFDFLVMAITFVSVYELLKVYNSNNPKCSKAYIYLSISYAYVIYCIYAFVKATSFKKILFQVTAFGCYFIIAFIFDLIYLAKVRDREDIEITPDDHLLCTKLTLKTMLYPTTLLGTLYGLNSFNSNYFSMWLLILVFSVTIFTDVFAYLFGITFHKGKFASQISPNKSMSGAIGGLFGGLVAATIVMGISYFWGILNPFTAHKMWKVILFFALSGLIGSLSCEFGDLVASSVKRKYGIKDYGKIFPGHGGMMDRVDGLMFCSTSTYILVLLLFF
ncbi:MAG: phosphatidate cytidylyltransferase [Christensenellales bacterium]